MDAKRSRLPLLAALGCGAVLGIAAIIAISAIVDAAPAKFDEPLGQVFSVLVAVLVLSLVVRLLAALFSSAIRASIASHEVAHAVCFGAAIIIVAFAYAKTWPPRYSAHPWEIQWMQRPRYEGRTMKQWLRTLASEPGRSGSPLDIIRTHVDTNLDTVLLEVPLSYDLLREHDFLRGRGSIDVVIDGQGESVPRLRGTNGNLLLQLRGIPLGLHQFEVDFMIGEYMHTRGSTQTVAFANNPTSH